jgi:hypothetical protein
MDKVALISSVSRSYYNSTNDIIIVVIIIIIIEFSSEGQAGVFQNINGLPAVGSIGKRNR